MRSLCRVEGASIGAISGDADQCHLARAWTPSRVANSILEVHGR